MNKKILMLISGLFILFYFASCGNDPAGPGDDSSSSSDSTSTSSASSSSSGSTSSGSTSSSSSSSSGAAIPTIMESGYFTGLVAGQNNSGAQIYTVNSTTEIADYVRFNFQTNASTGGGWTTFTIERDFGSGQDLSGWTNIYAQYRVSDWGTLSSGIQGKIELVDSFGSVATVNGSWINTSLTSWFEDTIALSSFSGVDLTSIQKFRIVLGINAANYADNTPMEADVRIFDLRNPLFNPPYFIMGDQDYSDLTLNGWGIAVDVITTPSPGDFEISIVSNGTLAQWANFLVQKDYTLVDLQDISGSNNLNVTYRIKDFGSVSGQVNSKVHLEDSVGGALMIAITNMQLVGTNLITSTIPLSSFVGSVDLTGVRYFRFIIGPDNFSWGQPPTPLVFSLHSMWVD